MQPRRLTLKNVFQHEYLVYDFQPGITGVVGSNGSGKSNFLNGLLFAQTGTAGDGTNKSDLLMWDSDTGSTVFEFSHDNSDFKLTRNLHTSLVKLESEIFDKPLKQADANAFMEAAIGMSFKGFYETCWTPQGTLTSILTCSHSVRVAFFQRLAKTREAETIRGIIQESGINKLPTFIDRTADITNLATEISQLDDQVAGLETKTSEFETIFEQYKEQYPSVQALLSTPTKAQHDQAVASAQAGLTSQQAALKKAQDSANLKEVPEAKPPTPEMERAKADHENRIRIQNSIASIETAGNALQERMPDVEVHDPEPLRVELEEDNKKLMGMKPGYDLATNKVCPTCHRPYEYEGGEDARNKAIVVFESLRDSYNLKHQKYTADKQAFDKYQQTTRSLQAQIDANVAQWKSLDAELRALPEDTFDAEAYAQTVQACNAYNEYLHAKQRHEAQLRTLEQAVDKAQTYLQQCEEAKFVSDDDLKKAQEFMSNYNEIVDQRQKIAAELSGAKSRKSALESQKERLEAEQSKRGEVAHTRSLFERAREKLHRDCLPKLVMQKMLYGLNALLDQYLSVFDTNFMARIDENFDFMCSFATKSDVPARALSGGQKVALSLAFKFAVSDLTATSVPFLVLDEPTVWLDEINKPRLAEVLTKAREVTEKGVYVLVATHEPLLFPSFSRIFDVSN